MTYQDVLSGADHAYCLNINTTDMCFERAAEHREELWLNGLSTGKKLPFFSSPWNATRSEKNEKWPKRSVQRLGLADGLERTKISVLYAKEAMIEIEPKTCEQPGC